jgi:hypothetical protein
MTRRALTRTSSDDLALRRAASTWFSFPWHRTSVLGRAKFTVIP